ncbi:MAG: hypothetical protein AAGE94_14465 [Acidobacteriota bacterium]
MNAADESTRRLRAAWSESPVESDGTDEPPIDADRVWRAVRGDAPVAERRELVERLHRDPDLALSWRLARELSRTAEGLDDDDETTTIPGAAAPEPDAGRVVRFPGRRRGPWLAGLSFAAAVVLAVGLNIREAGEDPGTYRPTVVYRGEGTTIEAVTGDALPRSEPVLRWRGPDGARFTVTVMTETLDPVATVRDLETPELALSGEILASFVDGTVLLWQIEARQPDGETTVSETFRTRIGSPASPPTDSAD